MYIRETKKLNTPNGKVFYQYNLAETYRVNGVVKQNLILHLGSHELLQDKNNRTIIAKLLEHKITNSQSSIFDDNSNIPIELSQLADAFYAKYLHKQQTIADKDKPVEVVDNTVYEQVDLSSIKFMDSREIGAEWMSFEMLKRLELKEFLIKKGWSPNKAENAMISIISRAVASYSENKTESWLRLNSGLLELFDRPSGSVSRHDLYKSAQDLYAIKPELEQYLYNKLKTLFDIEDTILIYDLTNTHFEGRKLNSQLAQFGRNKQKRNDCKQVVLAAVINKEGFLKHSNIYEGNMSEPKTLLDILKQMNEQPGLEQRLIVMDAGIATEDNLKMLQEQNYLYVCVSRSNPGKELSSEHSKTITIKDRLDNDIKLTFMEGASSNQDRWIKVESSQKRLKEISMMERSMKKFEDEISGLINGIGKKGATKRLEKVWERIGRIRERNRSVHKYYDINVDDNNKIVTSISYKKIDIPESEKQNGEYYLRTNHSTATENEIWNIYNTIREVESTFRCLKSDLRLRPVFHQKDHNTEAHLHLGLLAYHVVAPIRFMLKSKGLNYDWRNIVRIMNSQKSATMSIVNKDKQTIIIRKCTSPLQEVLEIYKATEISSIPFRQKKFVVTH